MSKELVEKDEIEMQWSEGVGERAAEAGTHCKLPAQVLTTQLLGYAENWTSFGQLEQRGPSALATLGSLVGLLETTSIPIFWKLESESGPSATWCTRR